MKEHWAMAVIGFCACALGCWHLFGSVQVALGFPVAVLVGSSVLAICLRKMGEAEKSEKVDCPADLEP